ncbi:MAG: restriction endonuclease subunit S [Clostridia bacterium]|nr:restriction endonuclease subunit S [Clostridia bacterium]
MDGIKYRKVEDMKHSGIEWIGKIPSEWQVVALKRGMKVRNGRELIDEDKDVTKNINVYGSGGIFKYTSKYLYDGESVLFGRKGTIGKPLYVNERFWTVDTMYYSTFDLKKYLPKFTYYILQIYPWNIITTQTALPSVVGTVVENIKGMLPGIKDQQKIANFLDIKTAQFDSIIAKKELLIQKLEEAKKSLISEVVTGKVKIVDGEMVPRQPEEMADSGVEWLGLIPKDWELKRVKNIAYLKSGDFITAEKIEAEGCFPVFGGNGLRGYAEKYNKHGNYILIGRQGALCGNIHYARSKFWASEHAIVVHCIPDINIHWFGELLRIMNLNQYSVTAAQPGISVGTVNNLYIPYPLVYEQQIIGEYIMKILDKIDGIIKKNKGQIIMLQQAKQSLISEAVIGKIDLRDWEIIEEGGVQ